MRQRPSPLSGTRPDDHSLLTNRETYSVFAIHISPSFFLSSVRLGLLGRLLFARTELLASRLLTGPRIRSYFFLSFQFCFIPGVVDPKGTLRLSSHHHVLHGYRRSHGYRSSTWIITQIISSRPRNFGPRPS